MTRIPQKGQGVRFNHWTVYPGDPAESQPPADPDAWIGEVVETWGICMTFIKVRRDQDGRAVILFLGQIAEILEVYHSKQPAKVTTPKGKKNGDSSPKLF